MNPAHHDSARQTKKGTWYRVATLPALAAFGRRFDELVAAYSDLINDAEKLEQAQREMVEGHQQRLADAQNLLKDKLAELAASNPARHRELLDRFATSPFANVAAGLFPGIFPEPEHAEAPAAPEAPTRGEIALPPAMLERLEALKVSDPTLYKHMMEQMQSLGAQQSAPAPEAESAPKKRAHDGSVRVVFSKSKTITPNHEQLFQWLVAHQQRIAADVRACFAKTAAGLESTADWLDDESRLVLPTAQNQNDHDELIRLTTISLDSVEPIIRLAFDTAWGEADVMPEGPGDFVVVYYNEKVCGSGDSVDADWDEDLLESASPELLSRLGVC
jgi:hypothetical protein